MTKIMPQLAAFALASSPALSAQCLTPATLTTTLPSAVASAVAVRDNFANLYVIGGNIDGPSPPLPVATANVSRFREVGGVLQETTHVAPVMPPMAEARAEHAAAADRLGRVYALGGWDGVHSTPLASCERYDPKTNTWSSIAPLPSPRGYCRAVASLDGMNIFVTGGQSPANTATNTVFRYDVTTNTWSTEAPMVLNRSLHGVAMGKDGTMYAVAGIGQASQTTIEARNPLTGVWSQLPPSVLFVEQVAACHADGHGRVHVMGAYQGGGWLTATTHQVFDPISSQWQTCASHAPPTNNMATVVADSGRVYFFGGQSFFTRLATIREVSVDSVYLAMTQHGGAGAIEVRVSNGVSGALALTVMSVGPLNNSIGGLGGLGTGWLGGLHASLQDVLNTLESGAPPLWMIFDGTGTATWSLPAGSLAFLTGLSLFASTHAFDAATFALGGVTYPTALTIR